MCASPMSWTCALPVLDRAGNTVQSATSSRKCVSHVSTTTASHPTALVRQPRPSTRPSPNHRSCYISTSPHDLHLSHRPPSLCSTPAHRKPTNMVAHTHNSQLSQSTTRSKTLLVDNHSSSTQTIRDKSTLCSQSPP
jgi:hypothetical protein